MIRDHKRKIKNLMNYQEMYFALVEYVDLPNRFLVQSRSSHSVSAAAEAVAEYGSGEADPVYRGPSIEDRVFIGTDGYADEDDG